MPRGAELRHAVPLGTPLLEALELSVAGPVEVQPWGQTVQLRRSDDGAARCTALCFASVPADLPAAASAPGSDALLVLLPPGSARQVAPLVRQLAAAGFTLRGAAGLAPDPLQPRLLFDLQGRLLTYLETVSQRFCDNNLKIWCKKIRLGFSGTVAWSGWRLLLAERSGVQWPYPLRDRYVVISAETLISLRFAPGGRQPMLVEKSGPLPTVEREWRQHRWAERQLGDKVPRLGELTSGAGRATLAMEYLPEVNLVNRVAGSWRRGRQFGEEVHCLLSFWAEVFEIFSAPGHCMTGGLPAELRTVVGAGLDFLAGETPARLAACRQALDAGDFHLLPQHGDFCVRNVLYRESGAMALIDWEDLQLQQLPLVDLCMLWISLEDARGLLGGAGRPTLALGPPLPAMLQRLRQLVATRLALGAGEWQRYRLLSLAWLAGNNLRKGRHATAVRIREHYLATSADGAGQSDVI